jgi:hypothetical protein
VDEGIRVFSRPKVFVRNNSDDDPEWSQSESLERSCPKTLSYFRWISLRNDTQPILLIYYIDLYTVYIYIFDIPVTLQVYNAFLRTVTRTWFHWKLEFTFFGSCKYSMDIIPDLLYFLRTKISFGKCINIRYLLVIVINL